MKISYPKIYISLKVCKARSQSKGSHKMWCFLLVKLMFNFLTFNSKNFYLTYLAKQILTKSFGIFVDNAEKN